MFLCFALSCISDDFDFLSFIIIDSHATDVNASSSFNHDVNVR